MRRGLIRQSRQDDTPGQTMDLTPMLDVVFILLIFFIVTASFVKVPGVGLELTEARTAYNTKPTLLVAIDQHDVIWMDKTPLNDKKIEPKLAYLQAQNPGGSLVIQVDKRASIGRLALVSNIASKLGISDIAVSTQHE